MKKTIKILLLLISFSSSNLDKLKRLTKRDLSIMERKKEKVCLIYIKESNISHIFFKNELSNFLRYKPLENYNFGFLDIENDKKLLEFFKIRNTRDSGLILYDFKNKNYYVEEGINHMKEVQDLFEKIEINKLNWSSNSIIEKIFFLITGKRYGKEAHSMFSFGICLISIIIYIVINIKVRREEREMFEKRFKTK